MAKMIVEGQDEVDHDADGGADVHDDEYERGST